MLIFLLNYTILYNSYIKLANDTINLQITWYSLYLIIYLFKIIKYIKLLQDNSLGIMDKTNLKHVICYFMFIKDSRYINNRLVPTRGQT